MMLSGKICLITGASSSLGLAVSKRFSNMGANTPPQYPTVNPYLWTIEQDMETNKHLHSCKEPICWTTKAIAKHS